MKPTKTVRGKGKQPINPRAPKTPKPAGKPVANPRKPSPSPLASASEDKAGNAAEFGVAFETGVDPKDKSRAMRFLKYLATVPKEDVVQIHRVDVAATVKVIMALLDDTDRLAQLLMWHMDVAEEGVNVVEMLLSDPSGAKSRQIAKRWYDSVRNEGPPSDLCSPNN